MVAGSYTIVTVLDEVRFNLGRKGTDTAITDAELNRFIFENLDGTTNTYTFQLASGTGATSVWKCEHGRPYGLYLLNPTMTCEADCVYVLNAKGSIFMSSGTPTATSISVSGTPVDFSKCMVQILHFLATHRCQEISVSMGGDSMSASGVKDELLSMADYWQGIQQIA